MLIIFPAVLNAQTILVSGDITDDTTWDADSVLLMDHVIVSAGVDLTIEPGVVVEAQGYFKILVFGSVHAQGTLSDSIYFTAKFEEPDSTGIPGTWQGIHFATQEMGADSSIIDHCVITKGHNDDGGGIYLFQYSGLRISNCRFEDNFAPNNGGAIYSGYSSPVIKDCLFQNNQGSAHGGGICYYYGTANVVGCTFYKNLTYG